MADLPIPEPGWNSRVEYKATIEQQVIGANREEALRVAAISVPKAGKPFWIKESQILRSEVWHIDEPPPSTPSTDTPPLGDATIYKAIKNAKAVLSSGIDASDSELLARTVLHFAHVVEQLSHEINKLRYPAPTDTPPENDWTTEPPSSLREALLAAYSVVPLFDIDPDYRINKQDFNNAIAAAIASLSPTDTPELEKLLDAFEKAAYNMTAFTGGPEVAAARSALRDEYLRLQKERDDAEQLFQEQEQELNAANGKVASLRAEVLTSDEAQAIWNELHKRDEPMLAEAWLSANAKLDRLRRISGHTSRSSE